MNKLISKLVNFREYLNANPLSIFHSKFGRLESDVSDLFAFRLDGYETVFIAENSLALLLSEHLECEHIFHFFDANGRGCGIHKVISDKFHYSLNIDEVMTGGVRLGGFVHHVRYPHDLTKKHSALFLDILFQHRGYTGFRRNSKSNFSFFHGNFGLIYIDGTKIKSLARARDKHVYTPQFTIKPEYGYDLIFSNPVDRQICIKFFLQSNDSSKVVDECCILSHATHMLTIKTGSVLQESNISWETSLPVGRCVVFEYKDEYFDVFHS